MRAWHFTTQKLRDGRPIPKQGKWLEHKGLLVMCVSGLHACLEPFDALQYAPGPFLHLVECAGQIVKGDDKLVCSRRRIVASMDATQMLGYFARMQALSVVHLWDAPDVVLDYLMTGEEEIKDVARSVAWAANAANAADAAAYAAYAAADAAYAAAYAARAAAVMNVTRDAARKDFNDLVAECFWEFSV